MTLVLSLTASAAGAQLPGLPVLQSAFPSSGLAVAVNAGHGDGRTIAAGAVGYGPRSGRFGLAAGIGIATPAAAGFRGSPVAYGARLAVTAIRFMDSRLALTPFLGFGATRSSISDPVATGFSIATTSVGDVVQMDEIPIGAAAGWRMALGTTRALALSVSPMYTRYRRSGGGLDETAWRLRAAVVADIAVTPRLGVTLGTELGQSSSKAAAGPKGSRVGAGVSIALARR